MPSARFPILASVCTVVLCASCSSGGQGGPAEQATEHDAGSTDDQVSEAATEAADQASDSPGDAPATCEPGSRPGKPTGADDERTDRGTSYNVRVPSTYSPTIGSPLIVVYAPAGADATGTETFVKLTTPATARGYVIAYASHITPQYNADFEEAATIPARVAEKWCIDLTRVYLTGHSDGGSIATLVAMYGLFDAAAIAPSAAGAYTAGLAGITCPPPLGVMVMHSSGDQLFPISQGFGAGVADWWAKCFACDPNPGAPLADGCVPHTGCAGGVEVQYCQGKAVHGVWPSLNTSILDFFGRFARN